MSYRDEVLRTCPDQANETLSVKLTRGALGLAGECGEVVDLIKKYLYHGKTMDRHKLILELGDVHWYLEYLAASLEVSTEEIKAINTAKLRARFPEGFSFDAANAKADEEALAQGEYTDLPKDAAQALKTRMVASANNTKKEDKGVKS